jgi:acyl carrier protein
MDLDPLRIVPERTFLSYGMDSMHAMMLVGDLEGRLGVRLSPTLVWEYPTVDALAQYIVDQAACQVPEVDVSRNGIASGNVAATRPDPQAVLAQLDGMSEAEMDILLQQFLDDPA